MTEEELNAIEARAVAATPGPWRDVRNTGLHVDIDQGEPNRSLAFDVDWTGHPSNADVAFICAARGDIPALLAEVKRLRTKLDAFEKREPLVHKLWFEVLDQRICECDECIENQRPIPAVAAAHAVRDFKLDE